jgi:SPP1 gp7 family putative phage head morphogenesis protein
MDDGDPGEGSEEDEDDKDEEDNDQHLLNLTKRRQFPGWEHDLRLIENSRGDISQAFLRAAEKSAGLRKKVATGQMFVSAIVLKGLISDTIRDVFTDVMTLMWTKAWNLGYESAESLVTGRDPDFERKHEGDSLQGFLGTEGQHWLDQVSRTGLGGAPARSDAIARTEVARAVNAAVIQCYRDNGVQYKHWIISPDEKTCKTCRSAVKEGIIPLDSIFPNSGLAGPLHVSCRCTVAPAGMNPEPVLAHLGKRFITTGEARQKAREDPSRLGWLLLRAKDEDGKYRFLLQQRSEGTWGMPGGTLHAGEAPWDGALRETTEEIGDLPDLTPSGEFHHMEDDGKTQVYLYLCDVPYFQPKFNGDTPEETQGAAWFRKKEIGELNLTPKFREDWEKGIKLKDNVSKAMDRRDTGEILTSPQQNPQGSGSRWNYPHDGDGTETLPCRCGHGTGQHECRPDSLTCQWCGCPERTYPLGALRPGGGQAPGEMGATEPPSWDMPQSRIYSGGDDGAFGRTGGVPPSAGRFPRQGRELQDRHPVTT